jgi:hypothetical protein
MENWGRWMNMVNDIAGKHEMCEKHVANNNRILKQLIFHLGMQI